jgi:DNA-binding NtrC family response regulator
MWSEQPLKKKILIIDDDPCLREALEQWLSNADYEVVTAAHNEEGLRLLEEDPSFHLVLTDFETPELNGMDLLRLLKSNVHLGHVQTIVMSDDMDPEFQHESRQLGALGYLNKAEGAKRIAEAILDTPAAPIEPDEAELAGREPHPIPAGEIHFMCEGLLDVIRLAEMTEGLPPAAQSAMRTAEKLAKKIERAVAVDV